MNKAAATVLIAEDNPILLQGLARALSANGYSVVSAEDGVAALELLRGIEAPPDLLLLDVMMPGKSGLEVLRAVQEELQMRDLPVVLITAATDEALPDSAQQHGAVDVLIKPFRLSELLSRIEMHIQHARDRREEALLDGKVPADPLA